MTDIVVALQNPTFDSFIKGGNAVLVDFWAAWCGPCKMFSPVVDDLAREYLGKLQVGKLNVDECPEIAAAYHILNIPTLVLFHNGEEAIRFTGYHTKEELADLIKANLQR